MDDFLIFYANEPLIFIEIVFLVDEMSLDLIKMQSILKRPAFHVYIIFSYYNMNITITMTTTVIHTNRNACIKIKESTMIYFINTKYYLNKCGSCTLLYLGFFFL